MEIGIIVALLLYFFSRGGQLGLLTGSGNSYQAGMTGNGTSRYNTGTLPGNFALQQSNMLGSEIEAGIGIGTKGASMIAADLGASATGAFAQAIPIVGSAVGAIAGILLAQHTARLKGAIAENQLIAQSVQAFDADIQQLTQAFNSGQASRSQCASAVYQMWNSIHSYMSGNATGPGRAWQELGDISALRSVSCDKACTAECCVFWNDMHPAMAQMYALFSGRPPLAYGGDVGYYTAVPASNKGKTLADGITLNIIAVQPPVNPAYGNYSRAAYTVTLKG